DNSARQLATARELQREHGLAFPLLHADAERVPLTDARFDVVLSEYGASIWCDPYRWIPEAARLLRPGGELVFLKHGTLLTLCAPAGAGTADAHLRRDYFGLHRLQWSDDESVAFTLGDVPAAVTAKATLLALDTLGNALAAAGDDFGRAVLGVAERLGGAPESLLLGTARRVAAANAVLANATLAHGLDFDDTREDAIVHTGCVAVTAALAVGEASGAGGPAVLEALIAAVEVMCRIGLAVPGALHARHFHPTAITGSFAAAAAAGRLFKLPEDQLVHAFGICGSQAAGIIEYLTDGSWTKRLHPGWAAHAGVVAALLAQSGFTGPETVFEGEHGFYRAFAGDVQFERLEELLASLGRVWELE